jgi:hypothetical protein
MNSIKGNKYIRTAVQSLGDDKDLRLYDAGQFFVASQGGGGGTTGAIFVEYVIEFFTPQVNLLSTASLTQIVAGGTVNLANPFGTAPVINDTVGAGRCVTNVTTDTIYFRAPGLYSVHLYLDGTGLNGVGFTNPGSNTAATNLEYAQSATAFLAHYKVVVSGVDEVNDAKAKIVVTGGTSAAINTCECQIVWTNLSASTLTQVGDAKPVVIKSKFKPFVPLLCSQPLDDDNEERDHNAAKTAQQLQSEIDELQERNEALERRLAAQPVGSTPVGSASRGESHKRNL